MMLAFHGDPAIKARYLARVRAHQLADEIVQQSPYWEHGKGCAVGCTIHGDDHSRYETELGIPRQIAYLQDRIFEGLANAEAASFPLAFLEAVPVGADLALVMPRFLVWLLVDQETGVLRFARREASRQAIEQVAALYQRLIDGGSVADEEWHRAAKDAGDAALNAVAGAAGAEATAAAGAEVAATAVVSNTFAVDAADAAYYAAYAASLCDDDEAAAAIAANKALPDPDAVASQQHYAVMRDKLLALLREAPVPVEVIEEIESPLPL